MHEHPSQALLDAFTILKHKKSFKGLQVAIIGDIYHSRVARSACHLLTKFGVKIMLCGPPEFVPDVATTLSPGLRVTRHIEEALRGTDVIMLLRVQKERFAGQKTVSYTHLFNSQFGVLTLIAGPLSFFPKFVET